MAGTEERHDGAAMSQRLGARGLLAVRWAVIIVLGGLGQLLHASVADARQSGWYYAGLALFAAVTIVLSVAYAREAEISGRELLLGLPLELLAAALLVLGTEGFGDPIYPWFLLLAVVYATLLPARTGEIAAAVGALAYLSARSYGDVYVLHDQTLVTSAFVVVKALAIVGVAVLVAQMVSRQSARESELERRGGDIAGLNSQLERSLAEVRAVSEISDLIHSSLDLEGVGPKLLRTLCAAFQMPSCAIAVLDSVTGETVFSSSCATPGDRIEAEDRAASAGTEASCGCGDPGCDPSAVESTDDADTGEDAMSCVTLAEQKGLSVVLCAAGDWVASLDDEARGALTAVAAELAVAVENSRLYALTKSMAVTDDLTGLANYRALHDRLDEELGRARRYERPLSFLMLDVDEFKGFNDTYGHMAGDTALVEIARRLRASVREVDTVARYGGEEFAVILPETDVGGAFVTAEKIREAVGSRAFGGPDVPPGVRLTISIGIGTFPTHCDGVQDLLRMADNALYEAKGTGRDRVRTPPAPSDREDIA
jgi:diguanylate cyclase (GGDEF)-like protein